MTSEKIIQPKLIELPIIPDDRGNLSFIESGVHVPFQIQRSYWIYDVPGGQQRGGHAYHTLNEIVIALSGSFDVVLDDGMETKTYSLSRSYYGLIIPKLIWRHLENFSTNSVGLILADQKYDEEDYIRDYKTFKNMKV